MKLLRLCALAVVMVAVLPGATPGGPAGGLPWKAGTATRKLTPSGPIWLAGYANRTAPSSGVETDVFAKALALDDGRGGRAVIVALDLVSIPRSLREHVEREAARQFGLKPHEILLNCSHTHSAPQVPADRMALERAFSRAAKPADVAAVNQFEIFLRDTVVAVIGESVGALSPAKLEFAQARAGFAMNRRRPDGQGGFSNNPNPAGPVDHDVPVLKVSAADQKIKALLFGYACHNTTLSGNQVSGDYAGHAQKYLEASYAGATVLFMTGCGGDQNPYPRRGMVPDRPVEELVKDHGRSLANAVATALNSPLRALQPPLRGAFARVALDYQPLSSDELSKYQGNDYTPPVLARAQALLRQQAAGQKPPPLECPVQVLQFGRDLTLVGLGGEVVVDYALRLKKEMAGTAAVWVAGYTNEVFGYLASRRVIEEGGYEGGGANIRILNHPGPFALDTEDRVVAKVHELHRQVARE